MRTAQLILLQFIQRARTLLFGIATGLAKRTLQLWRHRKRSPSRTRTAALIFPRAGLPLFYSRFRLHQRGTRAAGVVCGCATRSSDSLKLDFGTAIGSGALSERPRAATRLARHPSFRGAFDCFSGGLLTFRCGRPARGPVPMAPTLLQTLDEGAICHLPFAAYDGSTAAPR